MRLSIVEDNVSILDNLKLMLGGEQEIEVTGAFENATDALKGIRKTPPELMLVDLGLPDMPGIEFIRKAKAALPGLDIMVYTVFDDWQTVFAALKAGATGYILKGTSPRELVEAVSSLYNGGAPMTPKIARMVITEFHKENEHSPYALTSREKEILTGMDERLTYKELASRLNISPHTVRTHIKNIYEKLHTRNREDAILKAKKHGAI